MSDIRERIKQAADEIGGVDSLSSETGIPRRTLYGWISGPAEPKAAQLAQITIATGVSAEWLILGLGAKLSVRPSQSMNGMEQALSSPPRSFGQAGNDLSIRSDALVEIHKLLKEVHAEAGIRLHETDLLRMAVDAHNEFVDAQVDFQDQDEMNARMVLLKKKLQKQVSLAKAEPGTGKRSA